MPIFNKTNTLPKFCCLFICFVIVTAKDINKLELSSPDALKLELKNFIDDLQLNDVVFDDSPSKSKSTSEDDFSSFSKSKSSTVVLQPSCKIHSNLKLGHLKNSKMIYLSGKL